MSQDESFSSLERYASMVYSQGCRDSSGWNRNNLIEEEFVNNRLWFIDIYHT